MLYKQAISLFILFFFLNGCATAQMGYSTKSKKAIKLFQEAREVPSKNIDPRTGQLDYQAGIELLQKALNKDERFLEAHQLIGEYYRRTGNSKEAVYHFKKSLEISPADNLNGLLYVDIGSLQIQNKDFDDAIAYFDKVLEGDKSAIPESIMELAQSSKENAVFSKEALNNPANIEPINIGPGINTEHPEYFPTLTVDGQTMLFTREIPADNGLPRGQEDFYISHLSEKNIWMKADPMPRNINTEKNEGAPTISADGRTLVFVACSGPQGFDYGKGRNGKGSCDLFVTKRLGNRWMDPVNLPGSVNTFTWETQPSLSADGKSLYFIRRVGKRGTKRSDIFVSKKREDGSWGEAKPLPMNLNTPYEETSVLIHPDGQTLYFASNGHVGMGGTDIFMSRKDPLGNWGDPINLGYPINTENNENSLLVGPDGEIAFFASDRPGGYGSLDIYYFVLPEQYRPVKTTHFEGIVYDALTKKPLEGTFELIDVANGEQIVESIADPVTGEFVVALPTGKEYALNVSYPGYTFFSKNFNMKVEGDGPIRMDVPMIPITDDRPVLLENVFFDLAKSTLRKESSAELNKLYQFLKENESVRIEIAGHTDTRGNDEENMKLSQDRAKAVFDYLVNAGISADRLEHKGYGETKPIHSDEEISAMNSEEEKEAAHQENRRTEYKILN
jgi:outer membrane protein OmpA-like peptidoglycan-associated protein/tetratricopeptide (TPR) repeat protein